jgi:hypothetical protein
MRIERENFLFEFEDIGEGWEGDYDPSDPEDTPLLRFYLRWKKDGEWQDVPDCSYCTRLPTSTSPEVLEKIANEALDRVEEAARQGESLKRLCERLSWMSPAGIP